ncbi:MAG: 3-oxoacyl-[acyl-carrier-protein] reductase [Desulfobacterales bacterium]|nr:3-oxoacyl-[acyl-carrier-protein] reductase [Desulfobacterales bacterium]
MAENTKRTVVVTGGSRGIGRAICLAFADADTHVYFNYSSAATAAAETEKLVADASGKATGMCVNVADQKSVEDFMDKIVEETGRIDVLVNNAGITKDGLLVRMSEQDWDDVMDINLKGSFFCTKAAARVMMKQRSGNIVNITSVVGASGNAGQANYSSSKAGMIGFTKSVAKELAARGITVNAVAPGYIETDMTAEMSEKATAAMMGRIPLCRAGKPEDIAGVVRFLTSDMASYITGQVIHVNGGMYI